MVDETETPRVLDELSRSNAAPVRSRSERHRRTIRRVAFILALLTPLLLGVVLLAYQQWTLRIRLNQVSSENNILLETIESNYSRIAQLEDVLEPGAPAGAIDAAAIDLVRGEFAAALQQLQGDITELGAALRSSQGREEGRWQLVQAEHSLRLANQQLQLTGDVASALFMLETADGALAASGDPGIVPVRQAVSREISALRDVARLDTEGVYLRIGNLQEHIAQLPVAGSMQQAYRERLAGTEVSPAAGDGENTALNSGLDFLRSVFIWRKWEDSPDVMHPPQEAVMVRERVLLLLEESQLALMARQAGVYQGSLQQARNLVEQFLGNLGDEVPGWLEEMEVLLAVELVPRQPDITASLRLLQSYLAGTAPGANG